MFRALMLLLFAYFFFHLHTTGDLAKYINMKYAYLSYTAMIVLVVLFFVQMYTYWRGEEDDCHCDDHGHEHEDRLPWPRRLIVYGLFVFPLMTGYFLPIATLDSTIVKAKGFAFKSLQSSDHFVQTQYLKPDTSIYYGVSGYEKLMKQDVAKLLQTTVHDVDDLHFMRTLEAIYYAPGQFMGHEFTFNGFSYKGETSQLNQRFLLRFGIIHCIADSGVFGLLVEFPTASQLVDDEWISVTGTLTSEYYQPFKATLPVLKVTSWKVVPKPRDPYVYRAK